MIYSGRNTSRAKVFDVDTQQELRHVMNVDTDAGEIEVTPQPVQLMADGETIATEKIRFRSIYAIRGKEWAPCLFHCYGRVQ